MEDKNYFIACKCSDNDHIARFDLVAPPKDYFDPLEVFLSVHLTDRGRWYTRLWAGIKYIFGFKTKYGHWDEILLGYKELKELRDFADSSLKEYDQYVDALIASGKLKITPEGKTVK